MPTRKLEIINKLGLHARAAAKLVNCASDFESEVTITKDGKTVSGKSIMSVMMLAAAQGSVIQVKADGQDAKEALDAIEALVNSRFEEDQ